jgi:hypothetical protein
MEFLLARGRGLVLALVELITDGTSGTGDAVTNAAVWGVALGLLLVGLL